MTKLANRTALITGGARRVGYAISKRLAQDGANLIIHCNRSVEEAETAGREFRAFGIQATIVQTDLGDPAAVESLLANLERDSPPVDILVNCASVYYATPLADCTAQQWNEILGINLTAPFRLAQRLGLAMAERNGGHIINIADCSVRRPYRDFAPYLISKAALTAMTEVLALELAPKVQVNTVAPGTVLLPENASAGFKEQVIRRTPLQRVGTPEDVAEMVAFLANSGQFMTGGYYPVDGGAGIR